MTIIDGTMENCPCGRNTLDDFMAIGDGVSNDEAAWCDAKSKACSIYLPDGKSYLVTSENAEGMRLEGSGRVIKAVTGGHVQINSAYDHLPVAFRSHLWRVKNRIISSESLRVVVFGDSTSTIGYGLDVGAQIRAELENIGVGCASVANEAIAGHQWATRNLSAILNDYAEQKHLVFCKFGINEAGGTDLDAARTVLRGAMRQRLAEIRASTYGGYDDLSIALVMPNALGNASGNAGNARNNLWLESIRGIYVDAAIEYQCAIYDPYAEARNATGGDGRWLDANILVHPRPSYNLDIWTRAVRELLEPGGQVKRNKFIIRSAAEGYAPAASASLGSYMFGVSIFRTQEGGGYPVSGVVYTLRTPDNVAMQVNFGYQESMPRCRSRTWIAASGNWSAWDGTRIALPLGAGIVQTGSAELLTYSRDMSGLVTVSGTASTTTAISANAVVATLPIGYRPALDTLRWAVNYSTGAMIRMRIRPNGDVLTEAAIASGVVMTFQAITFSEG